MPLVALALEEKEKIFERSGHEYKIALRQIQQILR